MKNGTIRNSYRPETSTKYLTRKEKHYNLEKINKEKNNINNNNNILKKANSKNNDFIPKKTFTKQLSKFNNKINQIPYEKLEKEIDNILNDTNEKISALTISLSQIDINAENSYLKIQEEYSKDLENLYKERINDIKEINEQFDFDIYEKKKSFKEEDNIFIEINNKKEEKLKRLFDDLKERRN